MTVEKMAAPLLLPSAVECVRFERESFGALHQMMVTLSDDERADTWREIESELKKLLHRRLPKSGPLAALRPFVEVLSHLISDPRAACA